MYLTEFDRSRRLMKITVAGDATAEEAKSGLERMRSLLDDAEPGFRLLADLSAVESMPTSAAPYIGQVMESCAEKGVALVVRVLPADHSRGIGLSIMSRFHYPPDIPIITCATMEEAMRLLLDGKVNFPRGSSCSGSSPCSVEWHQGRRYEWEPCDTRDLWVRSH
jgi:hypothetical protein